MRRYGDYSPNAALLLTPARMGHLQRWAQLPWCDSSDPEERAAEGEGAQRVHAGLRLPNILCSQTPHLHIYKHMLLYRGAPDGVVGAAQVQAPRKLIGFAGTPEAQEALRKALLATCC